MASASKIDLIGVPLELGAARRGVDMGPSALRIAHLGGRLAELGYAVTDRGDLRPPVRETRPAGHPDKKYVRDIARVCRQLYRTCADALEAGATPAVVGGGHRRRLPSPSPCVGRALGRRPRRYEHARHQPQWERARYAAGRPSAGRASRTGRRAGAVGLRPAGSLGIGRNRRVQNRVRR